MKKVIIGGSETENRGKSNPGIRGIPIHKPAIVKNQRTREEARRQNTKCANSELEMIWWGYLRRREPSLKMAHVQPKNNDKKKPIVFPPSPGELGSGEWPAVNGEMLWRYVQMVRSCALSPARLLGFRKDRVAMLNDELHGDVLGEHIAHLSFDVEISHDCWREYHSEVLGRHLGDRGQHVKLKEAPCNPRGGG